MPTPHPSYLRRVPSIILHRLPALAFPPPVEPFGANGHIQDTLIQCCQFLFTRICALKLFSRAVWSTHIEVDHICLPGLSSHRPLFLHLTCRLLTSFPMAKGALNVQNLNMSLDDHNLLSSSRYTISLLFPSSLTLQSQDVFYRLLDHNMRNLYSFIA